VDGSTTQTLRTDATPGLPGLESAAPMPRGHLAGTGGRASSRSANGGVVEAHIVPAAVQSEANPRHGRGGEPLPLLSGKRARCAAGIDVGTNAAKSCGYAGRCCNQHRVAVKPASCTRRCLSFRPAKTRGDQPTSSGAVSRATASMTSRTRATLPSPAHWICSAPPGCSVWASRAQRRSWWGDPVQLRCRDDRVDRPVWIEVEDVLASNVRVVAEPPARECHHLRRRVHVHT
jgi:hypothetical protein